MAQYVVWFVPTDTKKVRFNQFHIEKDSQIEAIEKLKEEADFKFKVMGVGAYRGEEGTFINNKFY